MAFTANELLSQDGDFVQQLRARADHIQPKTFASGSGTLERLTPVAFNTSSTKWVVWTNGGSNGTGTIKGFIWPDPVVLSASGEVLGNVMTAGLIHFADIVVPYGETSGNLKTALRGTVRALGFTIQGLDNFY